jgi:hypothetical protein
MTDLKIIEKAADHLTPGWRRRRTIRKSNWHALKLVLVPICVGYVWLLYQPIEIFYDFINPAHSGVGPFSYKGGGLLVFLQVWIGFALFVPSTILGCLTMNAICWIILPAKLAFQKEAEQDTSLSFRNANRDLLIILRITLPLGFFAAVLGAVAFYFL